MSRTKRVLPASAVGVPVNVFIGGSELPESAYSIEGRVLTIHDPDRYPAEYLCFAWQDDWQPPAAPVAQFTVSVASGAAPLAVTFTDTSTGPPTSRAWDFGDGTAGGGSSHMHTYAEPGTYTVSLTVSNAAGTDTETKVGLITVTAANPDPQPDAWNPSTMLGPDQVHPNDAGMTYLADAYEWALEQAGVTALAGAPLVAYGDSWTANDIENTVGMRAIVQLNNRLGGTLYNNAVGATQCWHVAKRANVDVPYIPGTAGVAFVAIGLNDLLNTDTARHRRGIAGHLRAALAAISAGARIENTALTYSAGWTQISHPGSSGGNNHYTTTNGATATYTVTTPGDYYLLCHGADGSVSIGGKFAISQGGVTLATIDLNEHTSPGNVGLVAVRVPGVTAGTLTITFSTEGRTGATGWIDALLPVDSDPPLILAVKPVEVTVADRQKPALLDYIRDLYDTLAAEFGPHVVVCDPDPSWTP